VQSVTGHLTNSMTERYSHLDARQIDAIIEAQAAIAGIAQPKEGKPSDNVKGLKIVKMPDRTNVQRVHFGEIP